MDPECHQAATGVYQRHDQGQRPALRPPRQADVDPDAGDPRIHRWAGGHPRHRTLHRQELPTVERWDLLAYTNLGRPKYHRLDLPYPLEEAPLLTREQMESVWNVAVQEVPVAAGPASRAEPVGSGATRSVTSVRREEGIDDHFR